MKYQADEPVYVATEGGFIPSPIPVNWRQRNPADDVAPLTP